MEWKIKTKLEIKMQRKPAFQKTLAAKTIR
jgi:hypothetical protein